MHLVAAHVRKYKAVADSDRIDIEPTVTCLVGKNESAPNNWIDPVIRELAAGRLTSACGREHG